MFEWYANGPLGLEQGFTLTRRPAGHGAVSLNLALSGSLAPRLDAHRKVITFLDRQGRPVLRYTGLSVTDAGGRELPAWLGLSGHRITLHLDDRNAHYPVRIDPFIQAAELTSGDSGGELGWSMAMSGDSIAAGAPTYPGGGNSIGAVYVFTKPADGWADMTSPTAKLTDSNSALGDHLGESVGISGDTIVAGAHGNGYADVWVMPNSGWATTTTTTARLTDSAIGGNSGFGAAVGIDGGTIVVGDAAGQQAYVYVKPNTGWASATLPNANLNGGADAVLLGESVAVSGDTVAVGDPGYRVGVSFTQEGGVLVYVKPNGGWGTPGQNQALNQTATLTGTAATSYDFELGQSVAIDGSTIVAGAPLWKNAVPTQVGAAYVYTEPNTGWADGTQTAVLTASDGGVGDQFGFSVGVSGSTIVVGDPEGFATPDHGAAYVFQEPGGGWADATETQKLTASDTTTANLDFGYAVAIDGSTIAGSAYTSQDGRVYVFAPSPVCTWTPVSGTHWDTAANWDCGHVPTSSDDVVINNGTAQITGQDASARSLSINIGSPDNGGLQILDHTLTVSSSGTSTLDGFLEVDGTLTLGDPTTYEGTTDSGGINVQGTLEIASTFEITGSDGGGGGTNSQINDTSVGKTSVVHVLASGSVVRDTSSGTMTVGPRLDNDGTVSVKTGTLNLAEGDAGSTTGSYAVSSGAVLATDASGGVFEAPSITGQGTIDVAGGTTTVGPADTFALPNLNIHGNGTFTLDKDLSIAKVDTAGNGGFRDGTGTLNVTGSADFSDLHLDGGTTTVAASVPSFDIAHFLEVGSGATLNLDHATTYGGSSDSNGINIAGTLNIAAPFTISGVDGSGAGTPGQINNGGLIHVLSGGSFVRNTSTGTVTITPSIENDGTFSVQTGTVDNSGGLTQAGGLTTIGAGATFDGAVALNGGTLGGNGTIGGSVTNTAGTVAPGSSPGTLTVTGDYTQGSGGTLAEDITGTTPGTQFDRLLVSGAANLGGTLAIHSPSFTPVPADTFKIISGASPRTGTFAALTGATVNNATYSARYDTDGVTLLASGPPPPPNQTLAVTFAGTGSGSVSDGASLNCSASCQKQYPAGTVVTLNATAASGSSFAGWSGACSGAGSCQVTMSAAANVTATFNNVPPPPPQTECVVPKLKGKKLGAAKIAIRKAHCGVGKVTKVKSTKKHRNRVLSQNPKPGKHLKQGSKVALTVGT